MISNEGSPHGSLFTGNWLNPLSKYELYVREWYDLKADYYCFLNSQVYLNCFYFKMNNLIPLFRFYFS